MKITTLILIPAFNEAQRIPDVLKRISTEAPGVDVLVVDDGSTDGTAELCSAAGAMVIRHPFNLGVGAALQTGYKYAVRERYKYLIQLDGDGQHDPLYIPEFFRRLDSLSADVVIGSRFLAGNQHTMSIPRRVGGTVFSFLLSLLIRERITDPTSGYRGMNSNVLRFCISDSYGFDYPDADFLLTLHRSGFQLAEIPLVMKPRIGGSSQHSGLKPVFYVLKMFLSIFIILLRKKRVSGE